TPRRARIAVVGRGPVGLAAALSVADNGYDVILIGPPAPRDERTAALLAGSIALLTRLGGWPHLLGEAAPATTLRVADGTRRLFRAPEVAFESGEIGLAAFGYNLPNAILTAALEREIAERRITVVDEMAEGAEVGRDGVTISTPMGPVTAALVV